MARDTRRAHVRPAHVDLERIQPGDGPLGRTGRWLVPAAFVIYAAIAILAYWPIWPGDPSRLPTCACGDLANAVWYLRWTPYALLHGHNPLYSNWIDYPRGVNLAQNTLMPLLGFLGAPLTLTAGPIATFNLLAWLALPISATACFAMLRRLVRSAPAALLGGLLYGASPYMVGQAWGHLNLTFIPIPPLILLVLHDLLAGKRSTALRCGLLLGVLAAAQLLISPEILLSTGLVTLAGLAVLALLQRSKVREQASRAARGLAIGAMSFLVLTAYPIYFQLAGPHRYSGPPQRRLNFSADLLGTIMPTFNQRFAPAHWSAIGDRLVLHSQVENGSYLGVPLLIVTAAIIVWQRRMLLVRFSAVMAGLTLVLSLGPQLVVDTHPTGVPMPFALLERLPLFPDLLPARISLYTDLFVAIIIACAIAQLRKREPSARHARHAGSDAARTARTALAGLLATAVIVPLVPRWPYASYPTNVPPFFTNHSALAIPKGSVLLTYPYPVYPENQAMLWQAVSSMRFKLLGGYALRPQGDGTATSGPYPLTPPAVTSLLIADYSALRRTHAPGIVQAAALTCTMLRRYRVATVVAQRSGANPNDAVQLLGEALGTSPKHVGGVLVWLNVQQEIARSRLCTHLPKTASHRHVMPARSSLSRPATPEPTGAKPTS